MRQYQKILKPRQTPKATIAWCSQWEFPHFQTSMPISVKIWGKYIYEKICKGMEIRPTLRPP